MEDLIELNIGPQHPATHGVMRIKIYLDGEKIKKAETFIGFLHRGSEKIMENLPYQKAMIWTDRMDYTAPILQNWAYVLAIEKLLKINVPERAEYIRVILGELQRIAAHLVWLGTHLLDLGLMTIFMYTFELREKILDLFEEISGQRMNPSFFRIGGVAADVPHNFLSNVKKLLPEILEKIDEMDKVIRNNIIFQKRTKGIGVIPPDLAVEYNITGPVLRGSGIKYDVRKNFPYSVYKDLDFDIPVFYEGDVFSRYMVRMEEMRWSTKIIDQAIEKIPDGEILIDDFKIVPPPKAKIYNSIEEMIHHFLLVTEGFKVPEGEIYTSVESAKGEFGVYVISDGSSKPYRVHIRSPSFANLQILEKILPGHYIADLVAIIGSLDPVFGEVDR
ncbi:MAG: NADH-quinone oxidoreductase subunit D [Candidatus Hydrothermales bacterium]